MRNQEAKIYQWLTGQDPVVRDGNGEQIANNAPQYRTFQETVRLLPVLTARGYAVTLVGHPLSTGWTVEITDGGKIDFAREQETIPLAITTALIQLIESI